MLTSIRLIKKPNSSICEDNQAAAVLRYISCSHLAPYIKNIHQGKSLDVVLSISIYGYIRISQPLNMLNIKPVMRFIRISNARNSVNFCTIFPCAKDSS